MSEKFVALALLVYAVFLLTFAVTSYKNHHSCEAGYQRLTVEDVSACVPHDQIREVIK